MNTDQREGKLAPDLLERFIKTFLGYGNVKAPLWFIGKEEAGDCSPASLRERFARWQERGCLAVDDLGDYHRHTRLSRFLRGERQPTWIQLCRVALAAQDLASDSDAVLAYQMHRLGRHKSETALLEFLPLPAENTGHWPYGTLSDLPLLRSRAAYERDVAPMRIRLIQRAIDEHRPPVVVMYANNATYRPRWEAVAGQPLSEAAFNQVESRFNRIWHAQRGGSKLILMEHPTSLGPTNAYYESVGKLVGAALRTARP